MESIITGKLKGYKSFLGETQHLVKIMRTLQICWVGLWIWGRTYQEKKTKHWTATQKPNPYLCPVHLFFFTLLTGLPQYQATPCKSTASSHVDFYELNLSITGNPVYFLKPKLFNACSNKHSKRRNLKRKRQKLSNLQFSCLSVRASMAVLTHVELVTIFMAGKRMG